MMKQIHHATANKLYNQGYSITICPSNLSPTAFNNAFSWLVHPKMDHSYYSTEQGKRVDYTFREIVENFKSYNCNTTETGFNCTYWINEITHNHL